MAFKRTSASTPTKAKKAPAKKTAFKAGKFNMLDFGKAFLFEGNGLAPYIYLMSLNGTHVDLTKPIKDDEGNEYTKVEALVLLANALLENKGINCHMWEPRENDKPVASGNTRIDIKGISNVLNENIVKALLEIENASANDLFAEKDYLNVGRLFVDPGTAKGSLFKSKFFVFKPGSEFKSKNGIECSRTDAIALMMVQLWSEALYTSVWNNGGDLAGSSSVKLDEILANNVNELLQALPKAAVVAEPETRDYPEIEEDEEDDEDYFEIV